MSLPIGLSIRRRPRRGPARRQISPILSLRKSRQVSGRWNGCLSLLVACATQSSYRQLEGCSATTSTRSKFMIERQNHQFARVRDPNWSIEPKQAYFRWNRVVSSGCKGTTPPPPPLPHPILRALISDHHDSGYGCLCMALEFPPS